MAPPVTFGVCLLGTKLEPLRRGVQMRVRRRECNPTSLYIVNPQNFGYQVQVHNSCTCNELISLRNRHLVDRTLPEYSREYMLDKFRAVSSNWAVPTQRISYGEVVNSYSGAKKRMYNLARMEVSKFGLRKTDHHIKMFIKHDKYDDVIGDKMPRAIQFRQARYNLVLATYLKPFEHNFYNLPRKSGLRVITKGLNPVEVATLFKQKSDLFRQPIYLSCDHSKFDSTINVDHLKFEHNIYNRVFKSTSLKFMLKRQCHNKGFSRNGITYRVKGTRMSGDYNTGLGNSLINRAVLESMLLGIKSEVMLDGDDSIVIIEKNDLSKVNLTHFANCGFKTEVVITDNIQEVEYCKRRLCFSNPPIMVRNPIRALSNLAVTTYNYGALGFKYWALGALECERLSNPGIPIYRALPKATRIIKDAEYYRKLEFAPPFVDCAPAALAATWGISENMINIMEQSASKYLGWNSDNRVELVIKHLESKHQDVSGAFQTQQASISERFCALCPSADECWGEVSASIMGTATKGKGYQYSPGAPKAYG